VFIFEAWTGEPCHGWKKFEVRRFFSFVYVCPLVVVDGRSSDCSYCSYDFKIVDYLVILESLNEFA